MPRSTIRNSHALNVAKVSLKTGSSSAISKPSTLWTALDPRLTSVQLKIARIPSVVRNQTEDSPDG